MLNWLLYWQSQNFCLDSKAPSEAGCYRHCIISQHSLPPPFSHQADVFSVPCGSHTLSFPKALWNAVCNFYPGWLGVVEAKLSNYSLVGSANYNWPRNSYCLLSVYYESRTVRSFGRILFHLYKRSHELDTVILILQKSSPMLKEKWMFHRTAKCWGLNSITDSFNAVTLMIF